MIAVVTANFGGFDQINPIPEQTVEFERFYFKDENSPYPFNNISTRLKAKYFKIQTHRILNHDVIIWLDGNIQVRSNNFIEQMVNTLKGNHIAISNHPERINIYQEYEFIASQIQKKNRYLKARYNPETLKLEIDHIGPGMDGLYWCGCFARLNTPEVNEAFDNWWNYNLIYTDFDQITFVKSTNHLKKGIFNFGSYFENENYKLNHHNVIR